MNQTKKKLFSVISVVLSFLMIISVISLPTLKANADGSAGTLDDFVERCYTVTLDRPSDPDGFADWKGQLLNGKAVGIEIAYGFLFSKEYTNKNKDNDAYLKDLYMLFMGREPDESGYNDWMSKLNSGVSRLEVFAGFANSQEFYNICDSYGITAGRYVMGYDRKTINNVNLYVERMYKICLGRIGDKDGQKNWVEKLITKQISGSECARSFIFSKEYTNLGLSDEEFVENLYLAMFGRPSDADGKYNWLYGLKNGMTRDEVFAGFANSVEFDNICKAYGIDRGTYTATNKGTFDKDNPNNVPVTPEETTPEEPTPDNPTPEEPTPTHTHKYNKKNTNSKYLKSTATCTKAAVYYYSCECGEKGTATFTSGNPKGHKYNLKKTASKYLKSAAACTEPAIYYYSCECGEKDTSRTFTSGSALGHEWDNGTVTQNPTPIDDGVKTFYCKHSGCSETLTEIIPSLASLNVGDIFKFGKYEQDGDESNGKEDIEWLILKKENGKALVISEYVLDNKLFNTTTADVTWETSSLRSWLNNDFYNLSFSDSEKDYIRNISNINDGNSHYGIDGGNITTDKVFCLSIGELESFFGDYSSYDVGFENGYNQNFICSPTQYAINQGLRTQVITENNYNSFLYYYGYTEDIIGTQACIWWLRTPGLNNKNFCCVNEIGKAGIGQCHNPNIYKNGIRPAMYIRYDEHIYNIENTDSRYLKSAATHSKPAVYYYSCECGEYDPDYVFTYGSPDPSGHAFIIENTDDRYLKSVATHTEPATYYYSCECGEYDSDHTFTYGSTIPHDFTVESTDDRFLKSAATCTEPAVYYYSCECGEIDTDHTFTSGSPLGHHFTVENPDSRYLRDSATHSHPASYYYSCECGEMDITQAFEYGSPIPHEFTLENTDDMYLKSSATHAEPAIYYYSCECGEYDPDHTFTYGSPIPHDFSVKSTDSKYLKSAATCTDNAVYYYSCECGEYDPDHTFEKARSSLGHRFVSQNTDVAYLKSAATCTEPAVYYYKCVRCSEHGNPTFTYGEPLGHDCDSYTVTNEPTLTECGEKTGYCNRCSETVTESIPCLLSQANVGDIIKFGKYEQDGDDTNGKEDIEWQVLSQEDGRVLVISKDILDIKKYDTNNSGTTWENSLLRNWLNNDFMNEAFSTDEKLCIPEVTLENKNNSVYNTPGGNDTEDYVFCLSFEEAEHYFGEYNWHHDELSYGNSQKLIAYPTQKVVNDNIDTFVFGSLYLTDEMYEQLVGNTKYSDYSSDIIGHYFFSWGLRTPGYLATYVCSVSPFGDVGEDDDLQVRTTSENGVRPAMYIEYETE